MKKNSYISKMFRILSILLAVVSIFMSMSIYNFSQRLINNEIAELNSAVLRQVSGNASQVIADSAALVNKIAYDSKLIEFLELPSGSAKEDSQKVQMMSTYVENMISDYIWSQNNNKNLFEAYVIGNNGVSFTTYSTKYSINDVYKNPQYSQAFVNSSDSVLINTFLDPEEKGVYRYAYQVVREIRDHITQEPCGFVILNISEKVLYDSFDEMINNDKNIVIVDENGTIVSSKDKRQIEEKYIYFSQIVNAPLKESGYVTIKNPTGISMVFFDRIQGTRWYIIEDMKMNEALQPLKSIRTFIHIITMICIGITLLLSRYFAKKTSEPIVNIRNKMEQVTKGDLNVRAAIKNDDEFGQIAKSFNEMVQEIEYLLVSVKEEEHKKRLAELDFLRAQINPHFIYNTLSSIRFYVEMDKNEKAEEMLFHFSKLLRKTLSRSDEFITVREEINSIEDYVELQKLRYSDGFEVEYHISHDIQNCLIPTFILQPIVENSIFYSIGRENQGMITIAGNREDDKIKITIKDNGIGMSKKQIDEALNKDVQMNKVGLINVHERIQLNYGMDYGLTILSEGGKGTQVTLTLPVQLRGMNMHAQYTDCGR